MLEPCKRSFLPIVQQRALPAKGQILAAQGLAAHRLRYPFEPSRNASAANTARISIPTALTKRLNSTCFCTPLLRYAPMTIVAANQNSPIAIAKTLSRKLACQARVIESPSLVAATGHPGCPRLSARPGNPRTGSAFADRRPPLLPVLVPLHPTKNRVPPVCYT